MNRVLRNMVIKTTVGAVFAAIATFSSGVATGETNLSPEESFQIGGSCAGLAYLNRDQIVTVLATAFSDDMHSFCYPEEPSECTDYTAFLQGTGRLSTGDDGYHCSLTQ